MAEINAARKSGGGTAGGGGHSYSGGSSSGGGSASGASGSTAEKRQDWAEAYKDAVEKELEAEERKYDILKRRNRVSTKDYLASIARRADSYRNYADDVLKQDSLTADEQEEIRKEWLEKAEELETEYLLAYIDMDKAALDTRKKNGVISLREYWKQLAELRDKYFVEGSEAWLQYSEEIVALQKEEITKTYTEIAEAAEASFNDIAGAQNALENKLKGFGSVFQEVSIRGGGIDGSVKALRDFEKENQVLLDYGEALDKLKSRGKDILGEDFSQFFSAFADMSVQEGIEAVNKLLNTSDEKFNQTLSGWQEYQRNSEAFASEFYEADYEELKNETMEALREAFDDVPDTFIENGRLVAEAFGDGFLERIQSVFDEISSAINAEMDKVTPQLSVVGGIPIAGGATYNTTYHLATSSETVQQQLQAINNAEIVNKLRGN